MSFFYIYELLIDFISVQSLSFMKQTRLSCNVSSRIVNIFYCIAVAWTFIPLSWNFCSLVGLVRAKFKLNLMADAWAIWANIDMVYNYELEFLRLAWELLFNGFYEVMVRVTHRFDDMIGMHLSQLKQMEMRCRMQNWVHCCM